MIECVLFFAENTIMVDLKDSYWSANRRESRSYITLKTIIEEETDLTVTDLLTEMGEKELFVCLV